MDFSDALKAMKEGKKVKKTTWEKAYLILKGSNLFRVHQTGLTEDWYLGNNDIFIDDWEIVEDIPEVKIETVSNDYFTCPQCKKHNEYLSTDLKIIGCVRCGQKIKPIKDIKITYNLSEQYSFADVEWRKILPDWINIFELQQKTEKRLNNQDTFNEYLPNYNIDKPNKHKAFICKTPRY